MLAPSRCAAMAFSLSALVAVPAWAQPVPSAAPVPSASPSAVPATAAPGIKGIGRTTSRGRIDDLIGTASSAAEGFVGHTELEQRPILRPGELLETVPGVVISQHSGEGKANQYYLRGFNLDHGTDIAITVGGVPANMRTHAHGQGYSDVNWLIPEVVNYVNYRKGTYNADQGDFSTAGAVTMTYFNVLPRNIMSVSGGPYGQARVLLAASPSAGRDALPVRLGVRARGQHRPGPRQLPQVQRPPAIQPPVGRRAVRRHRAGVPGEVELIRPDSAAGRPARRHRSLRTARPHRRGANAPLRALRRLRAGRRQDDDPVQRVRAGLRPAPVLGLHVLPRRPGRHGPVRADRPAAGPRRERRPDVEDAGRREHGRLPDAQRQRHAGRALPRRADRTS